MDGNRRWAMDRGLPVQLGDRAGGQPLKQLARNCVKYGAKVLSLFNFSTDNWVRPEDKVDYIVSLLEEITASDIHELITNDDMRVSFVGNRRRLPLSVQNVIGGVEENSKGNKGLHMLVATKYSGSYDITEAAKKIATKVKHGALQVEDIDDALIGQHFETNVVDEFPNPDLLIRTSVKLRINNYMLSQLAYTELFFYDKMWPHIDEEDLSHAITAFQKPTETLRWSQTSNNNGSRI